jgi:choline dehydrogenase-like flavoprotein
MALKAAADKWNTVAQPIFIQIQFDGLTCISNQRHTNKTNAYRVELTISSTAYRQTDLFLQAEGWKVKITSAHQTEIIFGRPQHLG